MKCPFRNPDSPLGCELVTDPDGITGTVAQEFCEEQYCRDCPLLQAALADNLRYWSQNEMEQEALCIQPGESQEDQADRFWHLTVKHHQPHHHA